MKVARYYSNKDVRVETMPVPKIGPDEILVKIMASGICGSDVMEWYRVPKAPLVLGHEIAGVIEKVGAKARKFKAGSRVVVSHHVPCMKCCWCRKGAQTVCDSLRTTHLDPGGFAEFARVPATHLSHGVFSLPSSISFEEGSLAEPLGCVIRGQRLAKLKANQSVLVIGAGSAGLLHVMLAKALGARPIVACDINSERLKIALKLGAHHALSSNPELPRQLRDINGGNLSELVILCATAPAAIDLALRCVDRGGTILFFAPPEAGKSFPLPLHDLWRDGITLTSSYAAAPRDMKEATRWLKSKKLPVRKLITQRLPLNQAAKGFGLVAQAQNCLKVVLFPHNRS